MTLRKKTLVIGVVITLLVVSLVNASTRFILLKSVSSLEEKYCVENLNRAFNAIVYEKESLTTKVKDYAIWDETYDFIQNRNLNYLSNNLTSATFENLSINFFIIISPSGELISASGYDTLDGQFVAVPQTLLAMLSKHPIFYQSYNDSNSEGLIIVDDRPVLLAFHPVLTSLKEGPSKGMLVVGKYLEDEFFHQLSDMAQLSVQINPFNNSQLGLDLQTAIEVKGTPGTYTKILNTDVIAGYKIINDLFGNPAVIVRTTMERDIYNQSHSTIMFFIYVVFLGSILFLVTAFFLLDKQVLSRITNLSKSVTNIRMSGKLVDRVQVIGNDEISFLGTAINQMLQSLEVADHDLRQSRDDLEQRVEERTSELTALNEELKIEISEREESQRALGEAYNENQLILSSISSALIGVGSDRIVTEWNHVAKNLFGLQAGDVIGKDFYKLAIHWDWDEFNQAVNECTKGNRKVRIDDFHLDKPGEPARILGLTLTPLYQENEEIPGFLLVGSDITERIMLEQQVGRTNKLEAIGQLAAGVAHEINTPTQLVGSNLRFLGQHLKPILGLVDKFYELNRAVKHGTAERDAAYELERIAAAAHLEFFRQEAPKAIEQSLEGVDRISRIVSAMRFFMHPGGDRKELANLNQIIQNALSLSRNEWKNVAEVKTNLDPDLPAVECLPGELSQVILILVINAVHAIQDAADGQPDGTGLITITSRQVGEDVDILVTDSGVGIPEANRDKVFDLFFTTKEVGRGTGQGLAIAYTVIVKKHGGTIDLESELGCGTTFKIHLPLRAKHDQENTAS